MRALERKEPSAPAKPSCLRKRPSTPRVVGAVLADVDLGAAEQAAPEGEKKDDEEDSSPNPETLD